MSNGIVKDSDFPWGVYLKYVARHAVVLSLIMAGILLGFRFYFSREAPSLPINQLNKILIQVFVGFVFVALAYFAVLGKRYAIPLGRLINRTTRLINVKSRQWEGLDENEAFEASPEFFELEEAIRNLAGEIRRKNKALDRERQETEAIMSAVNGAMIVTSRKGRVVFINPKFALLFGKRNIRESEVDLTDVFRNPEIIEQFQLASLSGKDSEIQIELPVINSDFPRIFALSVSPIHRKEKKEGKITHGAVGIFYDITPLKQMERLRIDFVSNVSHELRTPLTSIKGYTDLLKKDLAAHLNENLEDYAKRISENSERLIHLVNDLLDLSAMDSGIELSRIEFDLNDLTNRVLTQLKSKSDDKRIVIHTRFVARKMTADPYRVEQVLRNLIENAIKYIPVEGKIEVVWESTDKNEVLLRVVDNGPGIPNEHLGRLFERFYRVDKGRSRALGGTGLGLAIVKHIMLEHSGRVTVKSEVGQGTEFICIFSNKT